MEESTAELKKKALIGWVIWLGVCNLRNQCLSNQVITDCQTQKNEIDNIIGFKSNCFLHKARQDWLDGEIELGHLGSLAWSFSPIV